MRVAGVKIEIVRDGSNTNRIFRLDLNFKNKNSDPVTFYSPALDLDNLVSTVNMSIKMSVFL